MNIEAMLRDYIVDNILFSDNGYPYPDEASFFDEGIVDSTGIMELVLFIEEVFGLPIETKDLLPENFGSVSKLAAYIRRRLYQADPVSRGGFYATP